MRLLAIYEICFGIGGLRICVLGLGSVQEAADYVGLTPARPVSRSDSVSISNCDSDTTCESVSLPVGQPHRHRLRRFSIFPFARHQ